MTVNIEQGDILEWAAAYDGPKFHALLCDPPYHLTEPNIRNSYNPTPGLSSWDAVDEARRQARAGKNAKGFMGKEWDGGDIAFRPETWAALAAHLLPGAFGMAFASSRGWHRLACAIEDAGLIIHPSLFHWIYASGFTKATRIKTDNPAWAGHRYGLQTTKPAAEPIIVFQKPYEGRPVDCITQTGAGALNVDGSRIPSEGPIAAHHLTGRGVAMRGNADESWSETYQKGDSGKFLQDSGRWPSNLLLSHLPGCNGTCEPGCPVDALKDGNDPARFFFQAAWNLEEADPFFYQAKASRKERDAGLDGIPLKEIRPLGISQWEGQTNGSGEKMGPSSPARNPHPTVKPLALVRYLATLLLPPAEYAPRRILVPFAGSGSECIGASLAGWEEVTGIEKESEYAEIGRARVEHWTKQAQQLVLL